ncbi:MAG: DoxX family membrane protein [Chloroflexi bacterium]|nr:DoxX family membrane protein [Chloroflexota bacterium]MCI0575309.1 DoxX family membrane protein [Chloroflexota bacterium]MCI0647631.1 DoxX family membrane protein [Chloroflexota bacterium]MCI0731268.1 DoxX family membrane protein [Chloroflexota bacterium]
MSKSNLQKWLDRLDLSIVRWLARYSLPFLRMGMGIIFLWFGALKFFPDLSPATDLAVRTIDVLTFGLMPANLSLLLLATLETAIGLGFLTGRYMRLTLALLVFQMAGTLTPLALFPGEAFMHFPYAPTLEGQYIIKNLVLIGAGLVIGSTVRGGRIIADPQELPERRLQLLPQPVRVDWRQQ